MKFVSILIACLAAVALAADDAKECEGASRCFVTTRERVIGIFLVITCLP